MSIIQAVIASQTRGAPPPPPYNGTIFTLEPAVSDFNGQIGWWSWGGSVTAPSMVSTNPPTHDAYTYPDGEAEHVYTFNGTDNWMISPQLTTTGAWPDGSITVDMWFYPTAYGVILLAELGQQVVNDGYNYNMMEIDSSGYLWARTYPGDPITSANTVALNAWNHVYFVHDVQNSVRIELNGNLDGTHAVTGPGRAYTPPAQRYFSFGTGGTGSTMGRGSNYFQGKIGTVYIYDTVAQSSYNATKIKHSVPELVLNLDASNTSSYPGTGTTWYNLVAGGHDATFDSAPAFYNGSVKSFDLAGYNWATLPADVWFNQDFTIVAWVKLHSYANWSRITDFGNGPDSNNVILAASKEATGQVALRSDDGTTQFYSGSSLPVNTWTQVVGRLKADGTGTIFFNGTSQASGSNLPMPAALTRNNCFIGKSNWNSDSLLNGEIGELQIYHSALSDATIVSNYNATVGKYT